MDFILVNNEDLGKLKKYLEKYGRVFEITDVSGYIEAVSRSDCFTHCFLNPDTAGSQPVSSYMHDEDTGACIVLVSDNASERLMKKYYAQRVIPKNPTRQQVEAFFPKTDKKAKGTHVDQMYEDEDDDSEGAEIIPFGTRALSAIKDDKTYSSAAVASEILPPDPVEIEETIENEPGLEVIEGDKAKKKKAPKPKPDKEKSTEHVVGEEPQPAKHKRLARYVYPGAAILLLLIGLMLFLPGKKNEHKKTKSTKSSVLPAPVSSASNTVPGASDAQTQNTTPATTTDSSPGSSTPSAASTPSTAPSTTPAPVPPPEPVNHPPTVSISGPTMVTATETATYSASASDPDGDPITYSWGSSTRAKAWSTPGLYEVSVTVTDSHGASASASISVRVI